MKRFGSRTKTGYLALLLALVLGAVVAVASAQAAPAKKKFDAFVVAANTVSTSFKITLVNDASSQQTLGSANFSAPGLSISAIPLTSILTADASGHSWSVCTGSGASACGDGANNVVELRSASSGDALKPGESVTVSVSVADPTGCTNATWVASAKQSNDYSGMNNTFNIGANDLTPLGSFAWDPIGTLVGNVFAPAILTVPPGSASDATVNALDTCGVPKQNYNGPATLTHSGLDLATVSGPTWSSGVGTVSIKPTISETDNTLTLTDNNPAGINATSDPFDTQQKICTSVDTSCAWHNGNNSINASAPPPATGSLGVGFNPVVTFTCNGVTGGNLGGTVITISPHGTPPSAYQVTLVYSKQVSGTGNANAFIFCESTDNGASFNQLPSCADSGTGLDCVVGQKRITGGALQVILNLLPGDPYVTGK
jgi:hypothetical protein